MAFSSGKITGTLHHADYGDSTTDELYRGTYAYTVTASGGGRLGFKIEAHQHKGDSDHMQWVTVAEKSKIQSDTTNEGHFVADDNLNATSEIRFSFSREFLSDGVDYVLTYDKLDD